eukprot:TRINITY_DN75401_c0_g1_i1.p1 TRINITY_DN75401_c0_g1~~TRINITY_DN75401_c0_g1_i1.p1  ORF type:complete len:193 (+),score=12.56 TRINITY_DN75401_c0_g1_i1:29-607(+)
MDPLLEELLQRIQHLGVKVVVFDMDRTICTKHSRGKLQRTELPNFLQSIVQVFRPMVLELHNRGIKLAIATHSDAAEHNPPKPEMIIGDELVAAVLQHSVPEVQEHFYVVAWNAKARTGFPEEEGKGKIYHMHRIAEHYSIDKADLGSLLLFDDLDSNVKETDGFLTCKVHDEHEAFNLHDALKNLTPVPPH